MKLILSVFGLAMLWISYSFFHAAITQFGSVWWFESVLCGGLSIFGLMGALGVVLYLAGSEE